MKKFNLIGTMLESFLFILFGIIILIWPKIVTNIIFNFAGILIIIVGIVSLVYFLRIKKISNPSFY